jgi:hypothetical protein
MRLSHSGSMPIWPWQPLIQVARRDNPENDLSLRQRYPTNLDIASIKKWINNCQTSVLHERRCTPDKTSSLLGLKVTDCEEQKVIAAQPDCGFVALSYLWGPPNTQERLSNLCQLDSLPAAIQLSNCVTRDLGFRYFWIDRYVCIRPDFLFLQKLIGAVHRSKQHSRDTCTN